MILKGASRFIQDDEGAVTVEYVLLFLFAVAALVVSGPLIGAAINTAYTYIVGLIATVLT